jgi:hypothetical protein
MSDHNERACTYCGSFLHHESACPQREKSMSNTPRTDAVYAKVLESNEGHADDLITLVNFTRGLERELTAQIEGHKLTAKEASEAAVLRAADRKLRAALEDAAKSWEKEAADTNWNGHIRSTYDSCAKDLRELLR